jgi:Phage integrase family
LPGWEASVKASCSDLRRRDVDLDRAVVRVERKRLGLRFHDLRHTAGTLAARTGATAKELMARLGHSSSRAAMIYQHAAAERDRLIAEGLDAMIAQEHESKIVAIDRAGRRPKRRRTPPATVARVLHDGRRR